MSFSIVTSLAPNTYVLFRDWLRSPAPSMLRFLSRRLVATSFPAVKAEKDTFMSHGPDNRHQHFGAVPGNCTASVQSAAVWSIVFRRSRVFTLNAHFMGSTASSVAFQTASIRFCKTHLLCSRCGTARGQLPAAISWLSRKPQQIHSLRHHHHRSMSTPPPVRSGLAPTRRRRNPRWCHRVLTRQGPVTSSKTSVATAYLIQTNQKKRTRTLLT